MHLQIYSISDSHSNTFLPDSSLVTLAFNYHFNQIIQNKMLNMEQLQQQVLELGQQKNQIIETLMQRITKQQQQIQILLQNQNHYSSISHQQLKENNLIFHNLDSTQTYLLLNITHLKENQPFIYQSTTSLTKFNQEIWDGIIGPQVKSKIQHTEAYCQMLLSDLQSLQEKIQELQSHNKNSVNSQLKQPQAQPRFQNLQNQRVEPAQEKKGEEKNGKNWNDLFPSFQPNIPNNQNANGQKRANMPQDINESELQSPRKQEHTAAASQPYPPQAQNSSSHKNSKILFVRK